MGFTSGERRRYVQVGQREQRLKSLVSTMRLLNDDEDDHIYIADDEDDHNDNADDEDHEEIHEYQYDCCEKAQPKGGGQIISISQIIDRNLVKIG